MKNKILQYVNEQILGTIADMKDICNENDEKWQDSFLDEIPTLSNSTDIENYNFELGKYYGLLTIKQFIENDK